MELPIAICTPDSSDRTEAWFVLVLVALLYFGLVIVAVRGAPPETRVRVAATWLFSAVGVTAAVWLLEDNSEASDQTSVLAAVLIVAFVTLLGLAARQREHAWPYVVAGSVGGITPIALLIALVAWIFASGGCLD